MPLQAVPGTLTLKPGRRISAHQKVLELVRRRWVGLLQKRTVPAVIRRGRTTGGLPDVFAANGNSMRALIRHVLALLEGMTCSKTIAIPLVFCCIFFLFFTRKT